MVAPTGIEDTEAVASDAELLTAWQQGDQAAGKALFERYYALLMRFFANKIGDDPLDLIHETFLGCISGQARLRERQNFRSFLFGIAYNLLHKHYGHQRRSGPLFDPEQHAAADLSPGPGTMLVKGVEQQLLLDSLRRIPVVHQVVLELFYWEGLTSAEIAEALGEPHGTVRTRLRRARQLLEEAMKEVSDDPKVLADTCSDIEGWAAKVRASIMRAEE